MQKQKTKRQPRKPAKSKIIATATPTAMVRHEAKPGQLSLADPEQVMNFGKTLQKYVVANALTANIKGKPYAMVSGWQFAGLNFGLTPIPSKPVAKHMRGEYIHILYIKQKNKSKDGKKEWIDEVPLFAGYADHKEIIAELTDKHKSIGDFSREFIQPHFSFECEVDIVRMSDNYKVGYGVGICSNLELSKSAFQEYAVNSMSQTRGIGKGYRNLIGFVMKSAGYEDTTAEEMQPVADMEAQFVNQEPVSQKPIPGPDRFKQILQRAMKDGSYDEAEKYFSFTDEQKKALEIAVKSKSKTP